MTKLRTILLGFLTISSAFAAQQVDFRYERDLIEMFDNPSEFAGYEKDMMCESVNSWLRSVMKDHIAGRIVLSEEDLNYLIRIGAMACDILNYRDQAYLL